MSLALLSLVIATTGIWNFRRSWEGLARTQLRLDRCVGLTTQRLRSHLNRLDLLNHEIQAIRVALITGVIGAPEARLALELKLKAAVLAQESELGIWQAARLRWELRQGCDNGGRAALARPLPEIPLRRPPPDIWGPQPLVREPGAALEMRIEAWNGPRKSAAQVRGGNHEMSWTVSTTDFRPGGH